MICKPLSFPRSQRLLNAKDYAWVFADASIRASNQHCLILSRPNHTEQARLGLIIAKKHIRLAVQRNRIKRIARESFRQQHQLPPINAIVLARKGLDNLDNQQLRRCFDSLWKKIRQKAKT